MAYIRTLLLLLVELGLFGVSQSSTESLSRSLQTANYAATQPSRVFSFLYLRFDNNGSQRRLWKATSPRRIRDNGATFSRQEI